MDENEDVVQALAPIVAILNELEVRHYVGGSVASSFHGAVRSTMDVDIVCELVEADIQKLTERLTDEYYASESAIREAIRKKASFNLIHYPTSFKVDVFISRGRSFDRDCMDRSQIGELFGQLQVPVATPEDSIIAKLEWYRAGNEVSERQWEDVSKLMRLLGDQADVVYLKSAAASVGVGDLLARLRKQSQS